MEKSDRTLRIEKGLKPILSNHIQVYTDSLVMLSTEKISATRYERLKTNLSQYQSNLIPLIVRRTSAYTEQQEFEVIYGSDWCIVAQEIGIEKLWAWVFDIGDEEINNIKYEMQQLLLPSTTENYQETTIDEKYIVVKSFSRDDLLDADLSKYLIQKILKNLPYRRLRHFGSTFKIYESIDIAKSIQSLLNSNLKNESKKTLKSFLDSLDDKEKRANDQFLESLPLDERRTFLQNQIKIGEEKIAEITKEHERLSLTIDKVLGDRN